MANTQSKKTRSDTKFVKGKSGNPAGRPKNPEIQELRNALERAKKDKNTSLLDNIVRRAYESDTLAVAILKKLIPDMTHTEVEALGDIKIIIVDYKDAIQKLTKAELKNIR